MQLDFHFDSGTEAVDDLHEPVHCETSEIRVANSRKIGSGDSGAPVGGAHAQAFAIKRTNDFGGEQRLELLNVRIFVSEIAKNIPASTYYFQLFVFHRSISFSFFSRSKIKSISRFGVLTPLVDFF
jgi:hypothetical protein